MRIEKTGLSRGVLAGALLLALSCLQVGAQTPAAQSGADQQNRVAARDCAAGVCAPTCRQESASSNAPANTPRLNPVFSILIIRPSPRFSYNRTKPRQPYATTYT